MITLIVNGLVYGPDPRGETDVLIIGGKIAKIGSIEPARLEGIGVEVEIIDASGCVVTPGFIDPHEHLHGGSGEEGFSTQTPEIRLEEIVRHSSNKARETFLYTAKRNSLHFLNNFANA